MIRKITKQTGLKKISNKFLLKLSQKFKEISILEPNNQDLMN